MTTCPSAPRQARGLRGAALRRLAGNKCPHIYQTHDMQPNRCDARPLDARWHGEAMAKIDVKATPEWLAQQAVVDGAAEGFSGFVLLVRANGNRIGAVPYDNNPGRLPAIRAWLVEQIGAGYKAGVEAGRAEVKFAPTDAAAEDAAIDGLVAEAIQDRGRECNAYTRDGVRFFYVGETDADVRPDKARVWLKGWLLAAWARGVAYGQQPNAPPVLVDAFGMAAREQIAAERAVDAAAVAPSEEALAAAREEGRRHGQGEILARLDDYVKRRRSRLEHAITTADAARKAMATAQTDEVRLRREVEGLNEAFDAIATEEAP